MKDFATYFNERMEDAEFAEAYKQERKEIDDFDELVRSEIKPSKKVGYTLEVPSNVVQDAEYVSIMYNAKERAIQRLIKQINDTSGIRRHTVPIIDSDPLAEAIIDRLVEERVQGVTVKRNLPVPRKLSEADMAQATAEAKELHVKMDRELEGMECLPPFGIRFT